MHGEPGFGGVFFAAPTARGFEVFFWGMGEGN